MTEGIVQAGGGRWLHFANPVRIVEAHDARRVSETLSEVERLTRDSGYHAVGFLTYEAGSAFGLPVLPVTTGAGALPQAWFAFFEPASIREIDSPLMGDGYELGPLTPSIDRPQFADVFRQIKDHLANGNTYQVNYTFPMVAPFAGDPRSLFADLVEAQRGSYSVFLDLGDHAICSASPELFFALDGLDVMARPMKGTAGRGRTVQEDRQRRDELHASEKQRAENVMIVDMVRNDLGRIADVGSVHVPELFQVERYPNVWQMTSLVTARSGASLEAVFAALHPSASVTGAPKVRTMEILTSLETEPRGVYTGAIGHVRPDGNARFSVAIRTAVVDRGRASVRFGVGSGIVWDSDPESEYSECLLKGSVLGRRPRTFELLETLKWTPADGFLLLDSHLRRLSDSAEYFGFSCSVDGVRESLERGVAGAAGPLRVRVLLPRNGDVRVEHQPLVPREEPLRVRLAAEPVDRQSIFLFHKTTNREHCERARLDDCDDVILWNAAGEATESTTANLIVEIEGALVTPPVESGLLAGTYRAELLGRGEIRERIVRVEQLRAASRLWLINSVHERREAILIG